MMDIRTEKEMEKVVEGGYVLMHHSSLETCMAETLNVLLPLLFLCIIDAVLGPCRS